MIYQRKQLYIMEKTGGRSIYIPTKTKIPIQPLDMDDWTRLQVGRRHGSRPVASLSKATAGKEGYIGTPEDGAGKDLGSEMEWHCVNGWSESQAI